MIGDFVHPNGTLYPLADKDTNQHATERHHDFRRQKIQCVKEIQTENRIFP